MAASFEHEWVHVEKADDVVVLDFLVDESLKEDDAMSSTCSSCCWDDEAARTSFLAEAAAQQAMRDRRRTVVDDLDAIFLDDAHAAAAISILVDDVVSWLSVWPVRELVAVSTFYLTLRLLAHRYRLL